MFTVSSHTENIYRAQEAAMFQRVKHRFLNIQLLVKPNEKWSGKPLHNATQRAPVSVSDQQLRGEFDEEVGAGEALNSLVMRHDIREIQEAGEAVRSLGRWRRWSRLVHRLLLVSVRTSRGLTVCLKHFTHRIGRDGGFCFEICFFSWVRIKLGRVVRSQRVKGL